MAKVNWKADLSNWVDEIEIPSQQLQADILMNPAARSKVGEIVESSSLGRVKNGLTSLDDKISQYTYKSMIVQNPIMAKNLEIRYGKSIYDDVELIHSEKYYQTISNSKRPETWRKVMSDILEDRFGQPVNFAEVEKFWASGELAATKARPVAYALRSSMQDCIFENSYEYAIDSFTSDSYETWQKYAYNRRIDMLTDSTLMEIPEQIAKAPLPTKAEAGKRLVSIEMEMEAGSKYYTHNKIKDLSESELKLFEKYFSIHSDGTLNSGVEVVLSKVPPQDVNKCLNLADNIYNKNGGWIHTARCSTHIHVDARDLIYGNGKMNYIISSDEFFDSFKFLQKNDWAMQQTLTNARMDSMFARSMSSFGNITNAYDEHYASIINDSAQKYGTLENRYMQGTWNLEAIKHNVQFNQKMTDYFAKGNISDKYFMTQAEMAEAFGCDEATVNYMKETARFEDRSSNSVIPLHPHCDCRWRLAK